MHGEILDKKRATTHNGHISIKIFEKLRMSVNGSTSCKSANEGIKLFNRLQISINIWFACHRLELNGIEILLLLPRPLLYEKWRFAMVCSEE